jgi:alpha-L-fucosidase
MVNADRVLNGLNKSNPMNTWDRNETSRERYLTEKSIPQVKELITKYPDMMQIWFDYWYTGKADKYNTPQISYTFYKVLYDISPTCLVSTRIGCDLGDYKQGGDNAIVDNENIEYWETPGTVNNTWGYSKFDNDWKTPEELIFWIVDIASKGGNYLLNVGPKADGTIPAKSLELLREVGKWMKTNGEAVYGTKRWKVTREGPNRVKMEGTMNRAKEGFNANFTCEDLWFSAKANNVYVISLVAPKNNKTRIKSMADMERQINSISLLGCNEKPTWKKVHGAIEVTLPPKGTSSLDRGFVLKVSTTE